MPKETDITRLEARVVELENALKAITAVREPVDLSAAEIKAYLKVRDALIFTKCACHQGPPPCFWGPCNMGDFGGGGLTRFTELGS